ncbi:MAG: aminotransferase class V-fold PLP-dependent enzyme [Betaproteobacteria bacterium]|nr:aminotransferase class V-fold PLP-dependent enzyme [Betaproteobacteria bacterium]
MAGRNFLFVPGPTNIPDRIQRAMVVSMEDHRSPHFPVLTNTIMAGLKNVYRTKVGTPFVFPSSGTGCWEAALTNTLSPGDTVLASRFGQFSHLWIDMCERLGLNVQIVDCEWGTGVPLQQYADILKADTQHRIKAVLACQNETATGVMSDIAGVREALDEAKHPALLFVDCVSSLGCIDFRFDDWGVDMAVSGSQKGLMLPPGLSFNAISEKALKASESARLPRAYWDWQEMLGPNARGFFPYTPASNLLYGLHEAIAMLQEEGLTQVFARHQRHAAATRAAVKAWGLEVLAKNPLEYSPALTAVLMPEGQDADALRKAALERFNLSLGQGLGKLSGKVFRIGHLGDFNDLMLMATLSGVEMALAVAGVPHHCAGVRAAMDHLQQNSLSAHS